MTEMVRQEAPDGGYAEHGYWERYQELLPEHVRLGAKPHPTEEWWSWQGHQVHLDRMKPSTPANTKVLLIHGGGGNGRLLVPLATALRDAGYESVAPDLPGYGLTRMPTNAVPDYDLWLTLLEAIVAEEKRREPSRKIVLFGLSVGGMTGYLLRARGANVDGVIATNLLNISDATVRHRAARSRLLSIVGGGIMFNLHTIFDSVKLPIRLVAPLEKMSGNDQLVALLQNDPHIGRVRMPSKFFRTMAAVRPPTSSEPLRTCPLLMVHPGADRWTPTHLSEGFFDRIESKHKEMVILENCEHFPLEAPGLNTMLTSVEVFLDRVESL